MDDSSSDEASSASLFDALLVYAEPLAAGVHAVIVGNAESSIAERLLDLGARSVHVFDADAGRAARAVRRAPRGVTVRPLVDDLDVRDGAFDLAVVPDLAELRDPAIMVGRLRRAVATTAPLVAMGRARLEAEDAGMTAPFAGELGPPVLEYHELYEVFAAEFDAVTLSGVVPFDGVVFAELGTAEEAPAVSVDTRLAPGDSPSVFVVVASNSARSVRVERPTLDPYSIVQLPARRGSLPSESPHALEAALAAAQLKADLLHTQLDEARSRLATADVRSAEATALLDRAAAERDGALTRAMELEAVLAASQQTLGTLERRLLEAQQGIVDRDDRIAEFSAELDARGPAREESPAATVDVGRLVARAERAEAALADALAELARREAEAAAEAQSRQESYAQLVLRAERAEAALALHVADLAHVAEAHAKETAGYEEQLRERARVIAELEKELVRREQLVKELVTSLEEARETSGAGALVFEAAAPLSLPAPRVDQAAVEEAARLARKLDELAAEVARRDGELTARGWRITELENELARRVEAEAEATAAAKAAAAVAAAAKAEAEAAAAARAEAEAAAAKAASQGAQALVPESEGALRGELDALRQALIQEHAARLAAESGEELVHARSEVARQAVLLEQIRGRAPDP